MGKIGIMGGTFDPIHNGHILIGKQAYQEYGLDEIWFMPSGQPPHKQDHKITDAIARSEMTKLAIEKYPYFVFSDFEVQRKGNTYTAETLKLLRENYPEHTFYFIIGADSLFQIEKWYHPKEVMELTILMVAGRDFDNAKRTIQEQMDYLRETYHARILRLHSEEVHIASAEIRSMAAMGFSIEAYVPEVVMNYINRHHLYQS